MMKSSGARDVSRACTGVNGKNPGLAGLEHLLILLYVPGQGCLIREVAIRPT
jgi:hypothetical protein